MRKTTSTWLTLLVCAGLSAFAVTGQESERRVRAEPIALDATRDGVQFVSSDRNGNVFLFRGGEKPAVYPISKAGEIGKPEHLLAANEALGFVLDAVLSPAGDQWLVLAQGTVRLFVNGKEKPLPPLSWLPWTVGFLRGTPVVGVMPRPLPSAVLHLQDLGTVPWFLTLDNDRWSPLVEHSGFSAEAAWKDRSKMNEWVAKYASAVTPARDGKLWAASQYSYRVQRLSPSGRSLLELGVGEGTEQASRKSTMSAQAAATIRQVEAQGGKAQFQGFTTKAVIADLVEGPDRAIYLLVHTAGEDSLAIDRYDPSQDVLERVPLSLPGSGRLTLAAGKDGLHVAPFRATEGLWKISWTALESAPWKAVEGFKVH